MPETVADTIVQMAAMTELERQNKLTAAWDAYYGTNELPLMVGPDGQDDNVRLNYSRLIVNKGVSWLFGADRALGFGIESDETAEARLNELWPMELRAPALHQMGVNGGVCGHAFAKLMLPEEGGIPRVVVLDPSNMVVLWSQEDIDEVVEFRYTWNAIDPLTAKAYARRQRTIKDGSRWLVTEEVAKENAASFEVLSEELWPYDWCPIFHCQNLPAPNEFYGAADLENDVLELVEAIEFVGGYARKLIRHKGHPLPYVVGEQADRLDALNVALGRMLVIPEPTASVGQLQSADLGSTLELYETLKQALYEIARVPATAFGTSMSNIAEETVELSFAPAVEKTWDKRVSYGPMLSSLAKRILELGGIADRNPIPQWTPVVPRSAKSEIEALERDLAMGLVSKQTAAAKRGYDWAVEEARIAEEKAVSAERFGAAFDAGQIDFNE